MNDIKNTVIFDFDGTLTSTDTTKFLILSLLIYKPFLITDSIRLFLNKSKCDLEFQITKNESIAKFIKNYTDKTLQKRLWLFRFLVKLYYRKEIVKLLYHYNSTGYLIIIATASPTFVLQGLFGTDSIIIGTEFSMKNGRYSGEPELKPCFGQNKADRVNVFLKKNGIKIADFAYSDNESDMPLLRCAQKGFLIKGKKLINID